MKIGEKGRVPFEKLTGIADIKDFQLQQ